MPNRSELSETYDRLMGLVGQLLGLNEDERNFVLDRVAPLPELEAGAKKHKRKKVTARQSHEASEKARKSPRAQSLSGAIQRAGKGMVDDDEDGPRCTYLMGDDAPCNATEHSPVHKQDGGYLNWHEFQPGKSSAPPAPRRSSANGVSSAPVSGTRRTAHTLTVENDEQESKSASSSTTSSATETEDVSNAVHAGG